MDAADRESMLEEDRQAAEALRFAGLNVKSVYDLVNTSSPYPEAIPLLIKLLHEIKHPRIREGVARALTVKEASGVVPQLIDEFVALQAETPREQSLKFALGNAISVAATEEHVPAVLDLMRDRRHGKGRFTLPRVLARAKKDREGAILALIEALEEPVLVPESAAALGKLKERRAIPALTRLQSDSDVDIRKAASKALKRIGSE